ncbi:hypothetical protein HKX48_004920 [Thoreauomyces humboldtii]|nr:hypothetical protein HKX48_004920 [Thoreauomyces humboldtii]
MASPFFNDIDWPEELYSRRGEFHPDIKALLEFGPRILDEYLPSRPASREPARLPRPSFLDRHGQGKDHVSISTSTSAGDERLWTGVARAALGAWNGHLESRARMEAYRAGRADEAREKATVTERRQREREEARDRERERSRERQRERARERERSREKSLERQRERRQEREAAQTKVERSSKGKGKAGDPPPATASDAEASNGDKKGDTEDVDADIEKKKKTEKEAAAAASDESSDLLVRSAIATVGAGVAIFATYRLAQTSGQVTFQSQFDAILRAAEEQLSSVRYWMQERRACELPVPLIVLRDHATLVDLCEIMGRLASKDEKRTRRNLYAGTLASVAAIVASVLIGGGSGRPINTVIATAGGLGLAGALAGLVYSSGFHASSGYTLSLRMFAEKARDICRNLEDKERDAGQDGRSLVERLEDELAGRDKPWTPRDRDDADGISGKRRTRLVVEMDTVA